MIWGKDIEGKRVIAEPNNKATCPICDSTLISKCGEVKMWHWAHKNSEDCDTWGEGETAWHLKWKNEFPAVWQEVTMKNHRADIYNPHKMVVIELQNSPISPEGINEREGFYKNMVWILNGETLAKNLNLFKKDGYYSFKWKWFPKSWSFCQKPLYIDLAYLKSKIVKDIEKYEGGEKHYSEYTECTYEWEDDYGNIREGEYPHYYKTAEEDTEKHLRRLKGQLEKLNFKDIFLIRKISEKGTGWGNMISKEEFLKQYGD